MDPQFPAQLVQFLAPYLPYLLKGVKLAGQEPAKKLGEKAGGQRFDSPHPRGDYFDLRSRNDIDARIGLLYVSSG